MRPEDDLTRSDVEALAATRAELGPDYEADLLAGFAERVEASIEQRVAHRLEAQRRERGLESRRSAQQLALGIVSVIACIPLVLALGLNDAFAPLVISLVAIVAINMAHAATVNRRH